MSHTTSARSKLLILCLLMTFVSTTAYAGGRARLLAVSKFTLEEAQTIVSNSADSIKRIRARDQTGAARGGAEIGSAIVKVRPSEVEIRGTLSDEWGGTFVARIPLLGKLMPLAWEGRPGKETCCAYVNFSEFDGIWFISKGKAQEFIDALTALRAHAAKGEFPGMKDTEEFDQVVAKYQGMDPKPDPPEEARRFKVQAERSIEKKLYTDAIDFYENALKIMPWWAPGYFNRALLLGDTGNAAEAITEMNKYLALEPNAPDARAAHDKIYQWETEAKPIMAVQFKLEGRAPYSH